MKVSLELVNFEEEMKRVEKEVERLGRISIHEKMDFATETLRVVTPVDTGEARSGWKNTKNKSLLNNEPGFISNEVEHIVYLNNGHSRQAPKFFIEQVLSKIGILTSD